MSRIKFAVEAPLANLVDVEPYVDFHFAIATSLRDHPGMLAYYKDEAEGCRKGKHKRFVMLDNGAFEANASGTEPVPLSPRELYDLAAEVQPQMVWAPDCPFDKVYTEHLSMEFARMASTDHLPCVVGFIPQGRTAEEIVDSLVSYGSYFTWIGLSFLNDRDAVLRLLGRKLLNFPLVHMLGLSHLWELLMWPRHIQYVDTSKPVKAAFHGKELKDVAKGMGLLLPTDVVTNQTLLSSNLQRMRQLCDD